METAEPESQKRPFVVGLTGGIACGKSSIASLFASLGVPVVDADKVARDVVEIGSPLLKLLAAEFGEEILNEDGSLNRRKLREIVFDPKDKDKLLTLNSLMAPAIHKELKRQIFSHNTDYVIAMIPLLFEHKLEFLVDRVLVVDVDDDLQLKRVMARDNITAELARSMIENQVSREYRVKKADDLIESDNSPLDKKLNVVLKLHNEYKHMSSQANR
ncbi:dephospho-CoA kinase [Succinivibrio dextrinosolvens]|uniref:dephospho-CoA kinase n=1 Tax=Succinivibrio dextrinosolvens TaxID=83771 RepID=UPI0008E04E15|nr:dephospho-CoA kinase [Succinivibrio dextrinosolvens]SFS77497.1 dephospho-CoA kinase [Succinivibrio dextrinosolvens]